MAQFEKSADLARRCTDLLRGGNDFPTIWKTCLSLHPLVVGLPHQRLADKNSVLDIKLMTGERLVFHGDARRFGLE